MTLLHLINICKEYKLEDKSSFYALKNISLEFKNTGMVAITGKSGCGKSTLINILSLIDKPDYGEVIYRGHNILKYKNRKIEKYRNENIGVIFQHYHLLEDLTVVENVMMPLLIKGEKRNKARNKTLLLLQKINFNKDLYNHKVKDLSGGEKQRIAILRSLINEPEIILADEPTGALDSNNAKIIMDTLKEISKTKLVIIVSHNKELVNEYADRVIELKDGQLYSDKILRLREHNSSYFHKSKKISKHSFEGTLGRKNFLKRIKRNLISIFACLIGMTSSLLIIGFNSGSETALNLEAKRQFDYGNLTIYKEEKNEVTGSKINIVKMLRPSYSEMRDLKELLSDFYIEINLDTLMPTSPVIKIGEEVINGLSYNPIYSFNDATVDPSLIVEGRIPENDNLFEVVINTKAKELLEDKIGGSCLSSFLNISSNYESHYYTGSNLDPTITDVFAYDRTVKIVGVVDELDFLNTPKIYYSYEHLLEYVCDYPLINLSTYLNKTITWYDRVFMSDNAENISSFSYRLFLKDYGDTKAIEKLIGCIESPYVCECNALLKHDTLNDLIGAASTGLNIFLIIAILGTCLILGIVSFSSYTEDKKNSAILSALGCSKNNIIHIYLSENLLIGIFAFLFSIIIVYPLQILFNFILKNIVNISNLINLPYIYIPIVLFIALFTVIISTVIPIVFAKKIPVKEELLDE